MNTDSETWRAMQLRLKHALQSLEVSAKIQLDLFPDFVLKAEELALTFDHWYLCVRNDDEGQLSEHQKVSLDLIDKYLDQMIGEGKDCLSTEEALEIQPEWEERRELSSQALLSFGWEIAVPPNYSHEYIPCRKG